MDYFINNSNFDVLLQFHLILYLNIKSKKDENIKDPDEIRNLNAEILRLKESLNSTINTSLSSNVKFIQLVINWSYKDMTEALTKVDEKVGSFNEQMKLLNQSQEGISKILA